MFIPFEAYMFKLLEQYDNEVASAQQVIEPEVREAAYLFPIICYFLTETELYVNPDEHDVYYKDLSKSRPTTTSLRITKFLSRYDYLLSGHVQEAVDKYLAQLLWLNVGGDWGPGVALSAMKELILHHFAQEGKRYSPALAAFTHEADMWRKPTMSLSLSALKEVARIGPHPDDRMEEMEQVASLIGHVTNKKSEAASMVIYPASAARWIYEKGHFSSCMSNNDRIQCYSDSPETVRFAILQKDNAIMARAILWYNPISESYTLDRIYSKHTHLANRVYGQFARELGWQQRIPENEAGDSKFGFADKPKDFVQIISCKHHTYKALVPDRGTRDRPFSVNGCFLPYMDTFRIPRHAILSDEGMHFVVAKPQHTPKDKLTGERQEAEMVKWVLEHYPNAKEVPLTDGRALSVYTRISIDHAGKTISLKSATSSGSAPGPPIASYPTSAVFQERKPWPFFHDVSSLAYRQSEAVDNQEDDYEEEVIDDEF